MFIAQSGPKVNFEFNAKNETADGIFEGTIKQECISQGQ